MSKVIELESLSSIIDQETEFAKKYFEKYGELMPMFIGYTPDGSRVVTMAPFANEFEKEMVLKMVTMLFAAYNCNRYITMSECWVVSVKNKEDFEKNKLPPSEHPDRRDGMHVIAVSRNEKIMRAFEVKKKNKKLELISLNDGKDMTLSGRFTELLPAKQLPPHLAKELREKMKDFLFTEKL